jgi:hypothetical protein
MRHLFHEVSRLLSAPLLIIPVSVLIIFPCFSDGGAADLGSALESDPGSALGLGRGSDFGAVLVKHSALA